MLNLVVYLDIYWCYAVVCGGYLGLFIVVLAV